MKLVIFCFYVGIIIPFNSTPSFIQFAFNSCTSSSNVLVEHSTLFQEDNNDTTVENSTNNRLILVQKRLIKLFYLLFAVLIVMAIILYRNFVKKRDLSDELSSTNHQLLEQKKNVSSLNDEISAYNEELISTNEQLSEQKDELSSTNHQLLEQKRNVFSLNEEISAYNEELISTNEQLSEQKDEVEKTLSELQLAQNKLIASEKMSALGVLTAGVAHEINNPLNYISSGVICLKDHLKLVTKALENTTKDDASSLTKDQEEELNMFTSSIELGVERISSIIGSLGAFSHQNNEAEITKCNLNKIIEDCLVILNHEHKNFIEIVKHYNDEVFLINADQSKLYQVFINLFINAIQAIKPNKGTINISINKSDNRLTIILEDTGIGIKPDVINKIFDPFFTTKPAGSGVGLGLSLVFSIIKEHKGTIHFDSVPDEGTTVSIVLPC